MTQPCQVCHRGPTKVLPIRRHVGMLVMQRFVKLQVPLCRDHAVQITRQYTAKTLWQGWWGYISFFVNFFVVVRNLMVLAEAKAMPAPQPLEVPAVPVQVVPQAEAVLD